MEVISKLAHFFVPRRSNNHKAKLLHNSSLAIIFVIILFFSGGVKAAAKIGPSVLGYASQINPEEVIRITNQKRVENGLLPLETNSQLSAAALMKGADMINKGYWAHVAPDGVEPWKFFADSGYSYRYAGENLARDFADPGSAVDAWMASPSHRENLLSPKYKDIGVAVVEGDVAGVDTTIIVQLFGSKVAEAGQVVAVAQASEVVPPTPSAEPQKTTAMILSSGDYPVSSPFSLEKNLTMSVIILLLIVFVVDAAIVYKRRTTRVSGRSWAHISFLAMLLIVIIIMKAGQIL